jgi:4-amino-4-deoxy-L-arabinose transferase-like glycosyltransferase
MPMDAAPASWARRGRDLTFALRAEIAVHLLLAAAAIGLFLTAPTAGDFWWSDAPRHAMNGAFIADFIRDAAFWDPRRYAVHYYIQYPALTILFYPILFYLILGSTFLLFGVSHATAQAVVAVAVFTVAAGAYRVARHWLPRWQAFGIAVLLIGAPEVAIWGRQIMLDVPALAFAVWSVEFTLRYAGRQRPRHLWYAVLLFVASLYTKQTTVFLAIPLAVALTHAPGRSLFRNPRWWKAVAAAAVLVIPLIIQTYEFGQFNMFQAATLPDQPISRLSPGFWTWYLAQLPSQIGPVPVVLAAVFVVAGLLRRDWWSTLPYGRFLVAWFGVGYLFFSALALKDPRFTLPIFFPVVLLAGMLLHRVFPQRIATTLIVALAVGQFATTLVAHPVPRVDGYRAAAMYIAAHAPQHSTVLFSGERDGSFIFNMRAESHRRDLTVLRSDKLLLNYAVSRRFGVDTAEYSEDEIAAMLTRYGVVYVVAQPDFWVDLAPMAKLQRVLQSSQFERVDSIPVSANVRTEERELQIYRNRKVDAAKAPVDIELNLRLIGRRIQGQLGTDAIEKAPTR